MRATEELRKEHESITLMLRILTEVASRLERKEPVPVGDLKSIVEFLSVFADQCHHAKEEQHLFPAMEAVGVPREGGPIGVMLSEHEIGRGFIAQSKEAIAGIESSSVDATAEFAKAARGYVELLVQHIEKENEILFPMAEGRIEPDQDRKICEAFERIESDRIGPGRHEEFHLLLDRLKTTYRA